MSYRLHALALAAVTFTACTEPDPSKVIVTPIEQKHIAVAPIDAGIVTPTVAAVELVDAGPIDSLALAHDAPTVDHLARARTLQHEGDPRGAITEARRALYSSPNDVAALELIATLAHSTTQYPLSAEAWGRVADVKTTDAMPLVRQARELRLAKDWFGAETAAREAIARDGSVVEAWVMLGLSQMAANELPQAIASFQKAVALDPVNGWAQNDLGFAYLRANENQKAVVALEKAAEKLPTVAYVHNNLGVALERIGRTDEAKAAYQHATDLNPKYVKARINSARVAKVSELEDALTSPDTLSDMPQPHPMPAPSIQ